MNITVTGIIEKKGLGAGAWALVTKSGETYELKNISSQLQKTGIKVELEGKIRDDIMTIAMIGPVLEIVSFRIIE